MPEPILTSIEAPPCDVCGRATTMQTMTLPSDGQYTRSIKGFAHLGEAATTLTMRIFKCEHSERDAGIRERAQREYWEGALHWGKVPDEYATASVKDVDWTHSDWEHHGPIIRQYFATLPERIAAGDGLYLQGNRGTGKTMLAAAVLNAAEAAGYPARFERVGHVIESMMKLQGDEWRQYRERIGSVRVLLLDEFGSEAATPKALEILTAIIDERHAGKRVTITTTNLTTEQMVERYQALGKDAMGRLLDRLGQRNCPLTFTGRSYRPLKKSDWWQAAREHAKANAEIPAWDDAAVPTKPAPVKPTHIDIFDTPEPLTGR
jgi:DNA replication protein DnaC